MTSWNKNNNKKMLQLKITWRCRLCVCDDEMMVNDDAGVFGENHEDVNVVWRLNGDGEYVSDEASNTMRRWMNDNEWFGCGQWCFWLAKWLVFLNLLYWSMVNKSATVSFWVIRRWRGMSVALSVMSKLLNSKSTD